MRFPDPIPTGPLYDNPALQRRGLCASVRQKAHALITAARETYPNWNPPPFNPMVYAKHLGIEVRQTFHARGWDALLVPRDDECYIICNAAVRSSGRRRFSLAHEIAHTFFDNALETYQLRSSSVRLPRGAEALERLCDEGAAELLMPAECFACIMDDPEFGLCAESVAKLAHRFRVSLEAAALRITQLAPEPCAIGFFRYTQRPSAGTKSGRRTSADDEPRRYRARCVFRSSGFPYLFPKGKSVPRSSVIYRAATADGPVRGREVVALGGTRRTLDIEAIALEKHALRPPAVCVVMRCAR